MEGVLNADKGVEMFEYLVNRVVVASAIPPTLNHPFVVSIDSEVPANSCRVEEVAYCTLKANSFGPTNVSLTM